MGRRVSARQDTRHRGGSRGVVVIVQFQAVITTVVWATVGTVIAILVAKAVTGLRVSPEVEYEGLDLGEHGERAYN